VKWISSKPKNPIQFPQLRGSLGAVKYPAFSELKYDGELNYVVYSHSKPTFTVNKYGNSRQDFPALNLITQHIKGSTKKDCVNTVMLIGELYWGEGKKGALYELLSRKKDDAVNIKVFDLIEYNGVNFKQDTLIDRRELMFNLGLGPHLVPCTVVNNKLEATTAFERAKNEGWEGVVIKSLDSRYNNGPCPWVKLKWKDRSDYPVTGIDSVKERIEIGADYPGKQRVFVGVKAPNRYKKHIAIGDMVTIEHQGVLVSGSLRHPVLIPRKGW
jgi:ATP-dependent DNA ligase